MPTYEFQARDGSKVEEVFPITSCPKRIKRNGKVYVRGIGGGSTFTCKDYSHRADSLPRWCPGFKEYIREPGPHYGKGIARTKSDIKNVIAHSGGKLSYGEGNDYNV